MIKNRNQIRQIGVRGNGRDESVIPHFKRPPPCRSGRCQELGGFIRSVEPAAPHGLIQCKRPFYKKRTGSFSFFRGSIPLLRSLSPHTNVPLTLSILQNTCSWFSPGHIALTIHNFSVLCVFHTKTSTKYCWVPSVFRLAIAMYKWYVVFEHVVVVGSLRPRESVDSEAVHAGVFWMTPVRQHPHLNDLEGLVILLHNRKGLQWLPIFLVYVVPQQLPFFLVLII